MDVMEEVEHVVIVATRAQLAGPSSVELPPAPPAPGLLAPDGSINWGCPCLGGMATGPCGTQFRDAFSCFHYSESEPKGSDCYEKFSVMQDCMAKFPELYGREDDEDDALAEAMAGAGDAGGDGAANEGRERGAGNEGRERGAAKEGRERGAPLANATAAR